MVLLFFEEVVRNVNLPLFLRWCGVLFEDGADGEGLAVDVASRQCQFVPFAVGRSVGVGIWEEDHATALQGLQPGHVQLRLASCGEPEAIGPQLRHHHSGLLRFHHTDSFIIAHRSLRFHRFFAIARYRSGRIICEICEICVTFKLTLCEKVQAEEAVLRAPVVGQLTGLAQQVRRPCRLVVVVSVTVWAVVHDLAVVQHLVFVDLPEDHSAVAAPAQPVALCCPLHLLLAEIAVADQCPTEYGLGTQAPLP